MTGYGFVATAIVGSRFVAAYNRLAAVAANAAIIALVVVFGGIAIASGSVARVAETATVCRAATGLYPWLSAIGLSATGLSAIGFVWADIVAVGVVRGIVTRLRTIVVAVIVAVRTRRTRPNVVNVYVGVIVHEARKAKGIDVNRLGIVAAIFECQPTIVLTAC